MDLTLTFLIRATVFKVEKVTRKTCLCLFFYVEENLPKPLAISSTVFFLSELCLNISEAALLLFLKNDRKRSYCVQIIHHRH